MRSFFDKQTFVLRSQVLSIIFLSQISFFTHNNLGLKIKSFFKTYFWILLVQPVVVDPRGQLGIATFHEGKVMALLHTNDCNQIKHDDGLL